MLPAYGRGRRILRPYGRAADPGTIRGDSARELPENLPKAPLEASKMGVKIVDFRTILEPKVTRSRQSGAQRGPRHPRGAKDGPRAPILGPKWGQGPFQSAKRTPDGALGATLGSLWEAFGTLWVTFGVILDTSGRQRRHF